MSENYVTEKEKAMAGLEFKRGDKDLAYQRQQAELLCYEFNNIIPNDLEKRNEIINRLIGKVGKGCYIKSPFICEYGSLISVGDNFFANYNCKLIDGGKIIFGDNILIGPDCTFVTAEHPVDSARRLEGYQIFKPITVGNNVWFGAGVTVCPGVTIGDDCVIGAGSVVVKNIPGGTLAVGNPCRVIKKI